MVYVTGDLHGEYARFSAPAMRRLKKGDTLIVCGDFGFLWRGDKKEESVLKKIGGLRYQVLFVEGCHDNYDLLREYPETEWNGGRVREISGGLKQLMRGELFQIEGHSYFTFGGGESTEHDIRTASRTWWEEEMPSPKEMRHGLETLLAAEKRVDYIITHEPSGKCQGFLGAGQRRLDGMNIYLNQLEENVEFKRWFFGSLHLDKPLSKRHLAVFQRVVPVEEEE